MTADAKAKLKKKDKRGAMYILKKKKMLEKQRDGIMGKKLNLDQQITALESAQENAQMVQAVRQANTAMKSAAKEMKIDDIDDLMDDLQENMDMNQEIGEALSNPMG